MRRFLYYIGITLCLVFMVNCTSSVRFTNKSGIGSHVEIEESDYGKHNPSGKIIRGKASYYADKFNGRKTSNGEIFSNSKLTAAHKTLPFGTVLKVTNIANGRSVIVKVNDRGPFVRGRILDLSRAAAQRIGMIQKGVAEVEIEIMK